MVSGECEGPCGRRIGEPLRRMPKALVYHIQINVSNARRALPFYRDFLAYLGYRVVDQSPGHMGFSNGTTDLWIIQSDRSHTKRKFHRKAPGLNHISFGGFNPGAVRKFTWNFLKKRRIKTLYGSPRYFPEYHKDYYAVYFEGPDRIKLELTFGRGKKAW
jgi:catechol 2,3-dioxygenase-like lactoylglutathione lyase family enzyme